jgi:hypothetical protein
MHKTSEKTEDPSKEINKMCKELNGNSRTKEYNN